jgi:hypothetical protein
VFCFKIDISRLRKKQSLSCLFLYFFIIMKAVITGASGLLGRAVTETFENSSWEGKSFVK